MPFTGFHARIVDREPVEAAAILIEHQSIYNTLCQGVSLEFPLDSTIEVLGPLTEVFFSGDGSANADVLQLSRFDWLTECANC